MDRYRLGWLALAGGVALGVGSGWAAYVWLETQGPAQGGQDLSVHPVVVASRDLPRGTRVGPDDVRVVSFPETSRPVGAIESVEATVSRPVLELIRHGEPLLDAKLGPADLAASSIALRTALHKRAYPIRVDGPAGTVLVPGDRIDLVATLKPTDSTGSLTEPTSRVVVENVPILDVLRAAPSQGAQGAADGPRAETAGEWEGIILEVTPEEAERVALAEHEGALRAVLRHPADTEHTNTPGVSQSRLLGLEQPTSEMGHRQPDQPSSVKPALRAKPVRPAPATQAASPPSTRIEVIRGGQRSEVTF